MYANGRSPGQANLTDRKQPEAVVPTQLKALKAGGGARGRRLHSRLPQSWHAHHGVDAATQAHQKRLPAR